jgi:DNA-binding FadR family transcriptional regulator
MLQRIERRSLATAVFDQLAERILGGELAAGEPLPAERLLCSTLGVSRTAVREALARLEQVGLIITRHGGKTIALDYRLHAGLDMLPTLALSDHEALRSGLEMRAALAPDIARLCAIRAGDDLVSEIDEVVAQMADTQELGNLQVLSMQFWQLLTNGSRNVAYRLALNSLRDAYMHIGDLLSQGMEAEFRDLKGYRAIAKAVRAHDEKAARRAAERHIEIGLVPMLALLDRKRRP